MAKNDFMRAMMKTELPKSMYSQDEKIKKELIVLDFLKKFIPPLATEERSQLEQNILSFGCKDPLIVWETKQGVINPTASEVNELCYVLIDGHNRYEICQKFGLDFRINLIEIPTLDEAQDFMIDHQLGRRNLSIEQMAYLRGMKYLALKQARETAALARDKSGKFVTDENKHDNDTTLVADDRGGHFDHHGKKEKLSEQLAKEFNVGEKTIRRDADFAKGLERLPVNLKDEVLQGKSVLKKADIIDLGKIQNSDEAAVKLQALTSPSIEGKIEKKEKQSREKILTLLKNYLNTAEECDALISAIEHIKKEIVTEVL